MPEAGADEPHLEARTGPVARQEVAFAPISTVTSPDGRTIALPLGELTNPDPPKNGIKVATEVLARANEALLARAVLELPDLAGIVAQALDWLQIPHNPDSVQRIITLLHQCPRSRSGMPQVWETNPHDRTGLPSRDIRRVKVGPSSHRLVPASELIDFNNAAGSPLKTDLRSITGPGVLLKTPFEVLELEGIIGQNALAAQIAKGEAPGFVLHMLRYATLSKGGRQGGGVNPIWVVTGLTWTDPDQSLQGVLNQIAVSDQASSARAKKAKARNLTHPYHGGLGGL